MGWVIVVVIVAVVGAVGWVLWSRSRKTPAVAQPERERTSRVSDPTPMTGLEVALDQVTDRSGRKMRDKIEVGTAIDDLIVPDDTGPLLRRALDNVEHTDAPPSTAAPQAAPDATKSEPAAGETSPNEG